MMLFRFVDDDQQRLRRLLLLIKLIQFHNSIHEHHKLLRPAIGHPRDLPWAKLYQSSDPASFLHMTGLTRQTFGTFLDSLFDLDAYVRHRQRGRPCSLGPEGYLGLLLFIWEAQCNTSICVCFLGSLRQFAPV